MIEIIKKYSKHSIVISILLIIFSIFLIIKPFESMSMIISIFGILVIIDGVSHITSYFSVPKEFNIFNFELTQGVFQLIFGIFSVLKPDLIAGLFQLIIGVWILMNSVVKFQVLLDLRRSNDSGIVWLFILTVLSFVLSLFIIIDPLSSFMTLTTIIGICILINEVMNLIQNVIILKKF